MGTLQKITNMLERKELVLDFKNMEGATKIQERLIIAYQYSLIAWGFLNNR
jgi:hypothetical protein